MATYAVSKWPLVSEWRDQRMSYDRICMYGPQIDPARFFGLEHVIPQGFGHFGSEAPALDRVCDDYNAYFGREFDQLLARDTYEGTTLEPEATLRSRRDSGVKGFVA